MQPLLHSVTRPSVSCERLSPRSDALRFDIQRLPAYAEDASEIVQDLESLLRLHRDRSPVAAIYHEWLSMLSWSGADPAMAHRDTIFSVHTLLVTLAQAILSDLASNEDLTFGFDLGWPQHCGANGVALSDRISALAVGHDWDCEALGTLHHALVPIEQRKSLGEYYTPKWLAEALSLELLDDAWICEAVANALSANPIPGVGVLDPTCGAGVLLVHAIRRLRDSEPLRQHGLSSVAEADVVSSLITGMDIHPVSVELARASIALALGAWPTAGLGALGVCWGDALQSDPIIRMGGDRLHASEESLPLLADPPSGQIPIVRIPQNEVEALHAAMGEARGGGHQPLLAEAPAGERLADMGAMFDQPLAEQDGWTWRFSAALNAGRLSLAGCDRIITNPPWVRMNLFPEGPQKSSMTALAEHLSLGGSGNTNSAFNVASIFVLRCFGLYLKPSQRCGARGGWILPAGAVRSDTWREARLSIGLHSTAFWDLSALKRRPFPGATSCVWLLDHPPAQVGRKHGRVRSAHNKGNPVVHAGMSWDAVSQLIEWSEKSSMPVSGVGTGAYRRVAQFGASLFPSNLVRVESIERHDERSASVVTLTARHDPWRACGQLRGEVPTEWLREAVTAAHLSAFWAGTMLIVLPLTDEDELDLDGMSSSEYWRDAKELWDTHRGVGAGTPKTLWGRFDHHKRISSQLTAAAKRKPKLICNSAGEYLRAARIPSEVIVDNSSYFLSVDTPEEAAYLVSLLNSGPLESAYRELRESDRQCSVRFWDLAPIPTFNPQLPSHTRLAELCGVAGSLVQTVSADHGQEWRLWGQVKRSHAVQGALEREGLSADIDEAAADVISHVTTADSATDPSWDTVGRLPLHLASISDDLAPMSA